jgi:hypothetical protein
MKVELPLSKYISSLTSALCEEVKMHMLLDCSRSRSSCNSSSSSSSSSNNNNNNNSNNNNNWIKLFLVTVVMQVISRKKLKTAITMSGITTVIVTGKTLTDRICSLYGNFVQ